MVRLPDRLLLSSAALLLAGLTLPGGRGSAHDAKFVQQDVFPALLSTGAAQATPLGTVTLPSTADPQAGEPPLLEFAYRKLD